MIYVTSDFHLWHRRIQEFEPHRPWATLDEMHEHLMSVMGDTVQENDTLYFLGDLYFQVGTKQDEMVALWKKHINRGEFVWVLGNHDRPKSCPNVAALFDRVVHAEAIKISNRKTAFLSHYPLRVGEDERRLVSIHGHNHGRAAEQVGTVDVGIDALYHRLPGYCFEPIPLDQALELAKEPWEIHRHRVISFNGDSVYVTTNGICEVFDANDPEHTALLKRRLYEPAHTSLSSCFDFAEEYTSNPNILEFAKLMTGDPR